MKAGPVGHDLTEEKYSIQARTGQVAGSGPIHTGMRVGNLADMVLVERIRRISCEGRTKMSSARRVWGPPHSETEGEVRFEALSIEENPRRRQALTALGTNLERSSRKLHIVLMSSGESG